MYNAIEIADSDDEAYVEGAQRRKRRRSNTPTESQDALNNDMNKTDLEKEEIATRTMSIASTTSIVSPSTSSDVTTSASTSNSKGRHRSRKSQHQTLRMSPTDLQFEMIPAPDDSNRKLPTLNDKYSDAQKEKVRKSVESMLNLPLVQELIHTIASERVRSNFLLSTYQLPDMNFALNTPNDVRKLQYRDRIRQRKDRNNTTTTTINNSSASNSSSMDEMDVYAVHKGRSQS